jgi:hypothetical protein
MYNHVQASAINECFRPTNFNPNLRISPNENSQSMTEGKKLRLKAVRFTLIANGIIVIPAIATLTKSSQTEMVKQLSAMR